MIQNVSMHQTVLFVLKFINLYPANVDFWASS